MTDRKPRQIALPQLENALDTVERQLDKLSKDVNKPCSVPKNPKPLTKADLKKLKEIRSTIDGMKERLNRRDARKAEAQALKDKYR